MDDVIIIGGSFAGLAGALQLVRARRKVTILDTGLNRNRFAGHSHGVLGHDHKSPADILGDARQQLTRYPTLTTINARAETISGAADDFSVTLDDGRVLKGRRILLAYGVTDQMPDIAGFAECWGKSIVSCPYCDGFEVAGKHWGLLYGGPHSLHATQLFADWTDQITVFANGHDIPTDERASIARRGFSIVDGKVSGIAHDSGKIGAVQTEDAETPVDVLFAHPNYRPSSSLHEALDIVMDHNAIGSTIKVDDMRQTSVAGIFAAGDLMNPMASVTFAMASGAFAAVCAQRSMLV
ncbi:MAG: NAD(P)/FAD-dependent oxidoreductase [Candidatus Devosia phytovorans]|uniref:Thioredoxin reductase n=1 Tax=Candidatus Devosia phytovorans TaxID=3121372 RepID=A0AAJ6AZN9_9HYPH|nr:NAD(P)/FAD-dependent oxidoreductase [Devosia sp.]WEK04041.1 MAG: NAD(P)/FAD-dependent oxidoreductase [Devosia sp.]